MRAFIALNLPASVREQLWSALQPLRDRGLPVRWTAAESIHLTVKFLGEVAEETLPELQRRLTEAVTSQPAVTLKIGGIGVFPDTRRARIWWVGVKPTPELRALHAAIEAALEPLGFQRDDRPFSPHLTVGRSQGDRRASRVRLRGLPDIDFAAELTVNTVDLMRSHLGNGPARYERIGAAPLGVRLEAAQAEVES